MSDALRALRLRERIGGKWQIPLLLVAILLFAGAILQIKPDRDRMPFEEAMAELERLYHEGLYATTIDFGQRLIERELDDGRNVRALGPARLLIGRAMFAQARREDRETPKAAREILAEFDLADRSGVTLSSDDLTSLGEVCEWMGDYRAAVEYYDKAIAATDSPSLALRRRALTIRANRLNASSKALQEELDEFIGDAMDSIEHLHWAVGLQVRYLLEDNRVEDARRLLDRLEPVYASSEKEEAFAFLHCLVDYRAGRFNAAESKLRALRNRMHIRSETYGAAGWLLGRVVLNDGSAQRPQEATSFFRDVINSKISPRYTGASHLGMAEALAELHRFDDSLEHYQSAISFLPQVTPTSILSRDVIRSSITVYGQRLREKGRYALALEFLELAASLVEDRDIQQKTLYLELVGETRASLARAKQVRARALEDASEEADEETKARVDALRADARKFFLGAGDAFVELARINTLNEQVAAQASWRAADLYDEGGARDQTIALLREFVRERPQHPLTPRAWLRLGLSLHSTGRFKDAIEAYRQCYSRFERTPEASQALIPLADCYMRLGAEYVDQAERTLRLVLDNSKLFSPKAQEFRDALFMLGDLLNREGHYEKAITTLEEALERYPNDPRAVRGLYLLADSYRLSAMALKEDLADPERIGERDRLRTEFRDRLERAAELFGALIRRYDARDESMLDEMDRMYLRHARLYRGDCLFDLQEYTEALKIFERAAWIYKDRPSSLAAYVQIINCHMFLGQLEEGRAALRRAQYLIKTIPDAAFANAIVPESRDEWKSYFDWIEKSGLLEPANARQGNS